jgi:hypothetical protein
MMSRNKGNLSAKDKDLHGSPGKGGVREYADHQGAGEDNELFVEPSHKNSVPNTVHTSCTCEQDQFLKHSLAEGGTTSSVVEDFSHLMHLSSGGMVGSWREGEVESVERMAIRAMAKLDCIAAQHPGLLFITLFG